MLASAFARSFFDISRKILGSFKTNSYLLNFGTSSILIDPASDSPDIVKWVKETNPTHNLKIFLTHGHFDHILGVPSVCDAFPTAEILTSEEDLPLLKDANLNLSESEKTPFTILPYLNRLRFVRANESLVFEGNQFRVLSLPGHTPGSIGLYSESQKCAFVGDTLFREAIGSTEFVLADDDKLMESIRKNLMTLPHDTVIYPGHGEKTTIEYEEKENIFISGDSMAAEKRLSKLFAILAYTAHETSPMDFLIHCI
jgi:glyoxylase-like metal-dependent hydrolase (beta-lactamase superfamily II)